MFVRIYQKIHCLMMGMSGVMILVQIVPPSLYSVALFIRLLAE